MNVIFSPLAERQTVRVTVVNERVGIRLRRWESGEQWESTNDVMVDGYCYTPAVSEQWLERNLGAIVGLVEAKAGQRHLGMGQWEEGV